MRKAKLVVHECYASKRKSEEVFAAVFLSNAAALTESTKPRKRQGGGSRVLSVIRRKNTHARIRTPATMKMI